MPFNVFDIEIDFVYFTRRMYFNEVDSFFYCFILSYHEMYIYDDRDSWIESRDYYLFVNNHELNI